MAPGFLAKLQEKAADLGLISMPKDGPDFTINQQRFVSRGGFGSIFAGTIDSDGTNVAVKVLRNPAAKEYFEDEYKLLKMLRGNPSIVHVYAYDPHQKDVNLPCIAMERADTTLEEMLNRDYRDGLPEDLMKRFVCQMKVAMKALWDETIAHRDIKPANVLVFKEERGVFWKTENIRFKLCDFGLSKDVDKMNEVMETMCGTDAFMAPDMYGKRLALYENAEVTAKEADSWSMAVTFYLAAMGEYPYPHAVGSHQHYLTIKRIENTDGAIAYRFGQYITALPHNPSNEYADETKDNLAKLIRALFMQASDKEFIPIMDRFD